MSPNMENKFNNMNKIDIGIVMPVYISKYLHLEFSEKTLLSLKSKYSLSVLIMNNYCDPKHRKSLDALGNYGGLDQFDSIKIVDNPSGNILSAAWNYGIDYFSSVKRADKILVINNDIILHPKGIDNLFDYSKVNKDHVLWSSNEHANLRTLNTVEVPTEGYDDHPHFSCFMVSPESMNRLEDKEKGTTEPIPGRFDDNFRPAYFEDGDMHNRILRAGFIASKTATSLFYHYGSRTIKVDEDLNRLNGRTYEKARNYFKYKWGIDPHGRVIANDAPERFTYKQPYDR